MKELEKVLVLLNEGKGKKSKLDSVKIIDLIHYLEESEKFSSFLKFIGVKEGSNNNKSTRELYIERLIPEIINNLEEKEDLKDLSKEEIEKIRERLKTALEKFKLEIENNKPNLYDNLKTDFKLKRLKKIKEKAENRKYKNYYPAIRDLGLKINGKVPNTQEAKEYFEKASEEERTLFNEILDQIDLNKNKWNYTKLSDKAKIEKLNEVLNNLNDEKSTLRKVRGLLHFPQKAGIKEYFEKASEEERILFNKILDILSRAEHTSENEKKFYKVLNEEVNNNPEFEKYKDKISIENLKVKQRIDTTYFKNNKKQDVDILIKFRGGEQEYKNKKFKGIGIQCDGEWWHSYNYGKVNKYSDKQFVNRALNDFIRQTSLKYIIIQWNEKDRRKEEPDIEQYARAFIRGRILPILKAVFDNDYKDERFDLATRSRQSQNQKLLEIAYALKNKANIFSFKDLEINNLSRYFLLNRKSLIGDKQLDGNYIFNKNKVNVWFRVLDKDFDPKDENWKEEIRKAIINNESNKNQTEKHSVTGINNFKGKDFEIDINNFDKRRPRKEGEFARLFKAIKKTSK